MRVIAGLGLWFVLLLIYFVPTLVAYYRYKKNFASIVVLNIFLGWTLVGWVVALCWALAVDAQPIVIERR